MALLRKLRSVLALSLLLVWFVLGGVYQRVLVWPVVRLWPARRVRVVSLYMRGMSRVILGFMALGGARFRRHGSVPTDGPALVLMNHQSLLDIPTAVLMCRPHAPAFVARRRYARFVPAVSLAIRQIGSPMIDPEREPRRALAAIQRAARSETHGLLIFPEGHRSRDGAIHEFKAAGVGMALRAQHMPVYLLVTDGFWSCRRLSDFVFNTHRLQGRTDVLGPFDPPHSAEDHGAFLAEMRERMVAHLERMRKGRDGAGD